MAAALAVVAIASAGCRQSDAGGNTSAAEASNGSAQLDVVLTSAVKTQEESTAGVAIEVTADDAGTLVRAEGVIDFGRPAFSLTMDAETLGISGPAPEIRVIGDSVYIEALPGELPDGKGWLRLGLDDFERVSGVAVPDGLPGSGSGNPAGALDVLSKATARPQLVGRDSVRGVPTERYHVVIDLDEVETLDETAFVLPENGELPTDVWIGDDGRVHKIAFRTGVADVFSGSGETLSATVAIELFDFGGVPGVEEPSPAETYEPSEEDLSAIATA